MKTTIYFILLLISLSISTSTQAQTWNLLQEGKSWKNVNWSYDPETSSMAISGTSTTKFIGDTLVNDTLYKKVYQFLDDNPKGHLEGFVRETDEGFFFRRNHALGGLFKETQLYYYHLKVGDQITLTRFIEDDYTYEATVDAIDSVLINGEYKKRYCLNGSWDSWRYEGSEDWIEGIGSLSSVVNPMLNNILNRRQYLLCYSENNQHLFKSLLFDLDEEYYALNQGWNLLQEGKQWNIASLYSFPNENFIPVPHILSTKAIKFETDTLVNDTLYKKVFEAEDEGFDNWINVGLAREDKAAFYFRRLDGAEGKIYDYNLEIGDTAFIKNSYFGSNSNNTFQLLVTDIDSIIVNGTSRKRFTFEDDGWLDSYFVWIEGVGSLNGILNPHSDLYTGWDVLLCYSENSDILFKDTTLGLNDCYYKDYVLSNDLAEFNEVCIHPNPVKNTIQVSGIAYLDSYKIYNTNGACVHQGVNSNLQIDVSHLRVGVYILELYSSKQVYKQKFVKVD